MYANVLLKKTLRNATIVRAPSQTVWQLIFFLLCQYAVFSLVSYSYQFCTNNIFFSEETLNFFKKSFDPITEDFGSYPRGLCKNKYYISFAVLNELFALNWRKIYQQQMSLTWLA